MTTNTTRTPATGAAGTDSTGREEAFRRALEVYAESYDRMAKMGDGKIGCADVAFDIRGNMVGAVLRQLRNLVATEQPSPATGWDYEKGDAKEFPHVGPIGYRHDRDKACPLVVVDATVTNYGTSVDKSAELDVEAERREFEAAYVAHMQRRQSHPLTDGEIAYCLMRKGDEYVFAQREWNGWQWKAAGVKA